MRRGPLRIGSDRGLPRLGEFDLELALTQLVGPIVFAKLIGIEHATPADCVRIVDDFLAARAAS
ncbi:hypothetical protein [Nocardia suismassiliense]|uniref:hypothetical protein n=1 Tax=Nocardia suismassiliense TaxID=2077092 RepID=UPI000D1EE03B|nr:hypothetical protein [Nocardia suismassiliense]